MSFFTIKDSNGLIKEIPIVKAPDGEDAYVQAMANGFARTKEQFQENLAEMNNPYQYVGAVYITTNPDNNPMELFGGEWESIDCYFIMPSSGSLILGDTGGEAKVKLEVENLPNHSHSEDGARFSGSSWYVEYYVRSDSAVRSYTTSYGGSQPHNNMPPYKTAYAWRRTAL